MHPVPASKSALKAILTARSAWAAVDIRDDPPTEKEDVLSQAATPGTWQAFWFEPTEIPQDQWASLGAQRRRITFRLGFSIETLLVGDDGRAAEDAVWVLFEDLMTALKASPNLTNTIQMISDVTGRLQNGAAPNLWQSRFTGSVECLSKAY